MRWTGFYLFTTREVPKDAEVVSHRLMIRAGMTRRVAAGIYNYLPLGWRSLAKLMTIVRRELEVAGCVELSMPAVQPAELWRESGRWSRYGKELLRIRDRHERDFCFGPTHEEVITDQVRHDVKSYRQLPLNLYQIQTKFRDEIRPRFGLMRGREFLMKDAYSFHADVASLDETYEVMGQAYERIFEACQLDFIRVEADSGAIGGSHSHEFMVVAGTGESVVVRCGSCDYAANQERAEAVLSPPRDAESAERPEPEALEDVDTPNQKTVEDVATFLDVSPSQIVKTLIYETDKGLVAVAVRGDREINDVKLGNFLDVEWLEMAGEARVREATGAPVGFAGPVGLGEDIRLIGDYSVRQSVNFVCGANRADGHNRGVNWGRDATPESWVDLLLVEDGDPCPRCGKRLQLSRGIEVGHIFQLGTKYSEPMKCVFSDKEGNSHAMPMGCYGLGIGRTIAAAIEQNHDDKGIIWPLPLAPFEVLVAPLQVDDPEVASTAERIYRELLEKGVDALYDDRDERPGVKFKDADLIGFPLRVVVGSKSLAQGHVEVSMRRGGERQSVAVERAVVHILDLLTVG
ncbi:MAG: proline--tRNA ligase [Acidobacteriota bacterium]|nr:proline--tRNA ligase [Acidobacteriota bacterium]